MFSLGNNINASSKEQLNYIHTTIQKCKKNSRSSIVFVGDAIHDKNHIILMKEGYNIKCIGQYGGKGYTYRLNFDEKVIIYKYSNDGKPIAYTIYTNKKKKSCISVC